MHSVDGGRRTLDALLTPRSVAVIGASSRAGHFANQPLVNLRRHGFNGLIFPVNPRRESINDLPCFPSVTNLPEIPDLAIVVVPPNVAVDAVHECGELGVGAAVVVASGFAESGAAEGIALQAELASISANTGIRLCGPNTLGVANWADGIVPLASGNIPISAKVGPVAVVSQSGGLGFTIVNRAWALDLGVGHLAVAGNEVDVTIPELASWYIERPDVRSVACYMESIRDVTGLRKLGERSVELGKPVFVLKSGRSEQGQRAAAAHTGALATSDAVCGAVLAQWGLHRVETLDGLVNAAALTAHAEAPAAGGVGVYCQGGGIAVVVSDLMAEAGVELPDLAPATSSALRELLPDSSASNPFDSGGQFLSIGPEPLIEALGQFDSDPSVSVLVVMAMPVLGERAAVYAEAIERAAVASTKPYVVVEYGAGELTNEATTRFKQAGMAVLDPPAGAVEGLATWLRSGLLTERAPHEPADDPSRQSAAKALVERWRTAGRRTVPEHEAVELLELYGIKTARQELVRTSEGALSAAGRLGGLVVMKIASPDLPHRSDVGGVRLRVDPTDAGDVFLELMQSVAAAAPGAVIDGVSIVEMVEPGLELILGAHRDPTFGLVVLAGLGGVLTEVLDDASVRVPPLGPRRGRADVQRAPWCGAAERPPRC